jgi:hypothetical protein
MPQTKRVASLPEHEVGVHVSLLELAANVEERAVHLCTVVDQWGERDAVRVLVAYADRYPRGAVLLAPYFFWQVAEKMLARSEVETAESAVLQKLAELTAITQYVVRGG